MSGSRFFSFSARGKPSAVILLSILAISIFANRAWSQNLSDFQKQKQFWEDQAFYCQSGLDVFPSKQDDPFNPLDRYNPAIPKATWTKHYASTQCDAGDMTLFNGLLCAAGDERGCKGVAIAQDDGGRWWRAKSLFNQIDTAEQASFSTDQALGVYLYLSKTGDRDRFQKWLTYMGSSWNLPERAR